METKTQQLFGLAVSTVVQAGCVLYPISAFNHNYGDCHNMCTWDNMCRIAPDIPWNNIPGEKKAQINANVDICVAYWCDPLQKK
jgi:hypothetical protein